MKKKYNYISPIKKIAKCPSCESRKESRPVRRMVAILVEREQEKYLTEGYETAVASALREYCDRLLLDSYHGQRLGSASEEFKAENGCTVRVIAGLYDVK